MADKELSSHIQDSIVFLAIMSTDFLKLVRNYVRPELLSGDVIFWVLKACYHYYDLTKSAPGDHLCDVLDDQLHGLSEEKKQLIYHFLDRISQMKEPNVIYVMRRLNDFVKTKEFELAAVEFVRLVERKDFSAAELLMYNALKAGISKENIGCDYLFDFTSIYNSDEIKETLFSMGLEHFDKLRKFHREELVCVLGGQKGKKSWCGIHIGKMALQRGLNVLHLTHENSQEETEGRYDRALGALAHEDFYGKQVPIRYIDPVTNQLKTVFETRPNIRDQKAREEVRKLVRRFGGRLIIKKYPPLTCDMREAERLLDYLERFENFVPDVFINDYPDIMKPMDSNMILRDQLNNTYMYNKRLVDERRMLGIVFSQAVREAIRAKRLTMKHFAEDIRKLANVDTALGVCQTDVQAEADLATLYVIAARSGKMDTGCGIVMNLDIGQFASCSFPVKLGVQVAEEEEEKEEKDKASGYSDSNRDKSA